jgi:3'(2'), 5'-bisphosphate nucleotidase
MPSGVPGDGTQIAAKMLDVFKRAALEAGQAILEVYRAGPHVHLKRDCSPVTEADERAEAIILKHLAEAFPEIPVIAEESVEAGTLPTDAGATFFLVDPLDGTREFINRNDDFTVNIALIQHGVPVAGIVYAPAKQVGYAAQHGKAEKFSVSDRFEIRDLQPIASRAYAKIPVALISRSHCNAETTDFVTAHKISEFTSIGSSLKFGLLAEGKADVYPRYSRTMLWDTAAGDAVLRAAGGITLDLDGQPLNYRPADIRTSADLANPSFVAWGRAPAA